MPDVVLILDGSRVGAVNYRDLHLRWQDSRFIEDGRVPSDAKIVAHTWKHPNKSGGPDRRFKDNRQIPICLYETIHFQSDSGVNELVEFSRTGRAANFAHGCRLIAQLPKEATRSLTTTVPTQVAPETEHQPQFPRKRRPLRTFAFIVLGVIIGLPLLGLLLPTNELSTPAALRTGGEQTTSETPAVAVSQENLGKAEAAAHAVLPDTAVDPTTSSPIGISTQEQTAASSQPSPTQKMESSAVPEDVAPRPAWHTTTAVNLREGPGTKFRVLLVIQDGSQVAVIEQRGRWSLVKMSDEVTGWMTSKAISPDNQERMPTQSD
ncbi:SH3 domain-containing protein [Rhizobium leguminosarum]|uniref:SH3 domain-containing protein n=1 Tax=Rhizobium leguminosarum TaxID=384 RepID=UPI001C984EFD|nr:SH3 domain-containing protein [Rhizobium leguminosarum]MBY5439079.1 SH3 domain-containing protein [Rhizobium leguminosarum]